MVDKVLMIMILNTLKTIYQSTEFPVFAMLFTYYFYNVLFSRYCFFS